MIPAPPALLLLAQRLRELRERQWPEVRLTQAQLADALGNAAPATVSSWESPSAPKLPPAKRLLSYALFFASRRSLEGGPHLLSPNSLTDEEKATCEALEQELLALREQARKPTQRTEIAVHRSWHFADPGPLTIVCAELPRKLAGTYADPNDPNYTVLRSFADLDALMELHGHVRSENPTMGVFFKASSVVLPDDLSGHVVLLGGIAYNAVTQRLSKMTSLPVRQVDNPEIITSGDIFEVGSGKTTEKFLPVWEDEQNEILAEDVGLLARLPNPLNSNRSLTICNGIHSRGVFGAVRSLTDAQIRDSNERYIASNFTDSSPFAILMRVPVIGGQTITPDLNAPDSVLYQWP
jgi:hypothetical protein